MKLEEVLQRVQSLYSHGVQSDDTRLTSRHIYSACKSARATLIEQKANKKQHVSQWAYQTIPCIELITVPVHECPCVPPNGCVMLRSKFKIPDVVHSMDAPLIQAITNLDGNIRYSMTRFENRKYTVGNKYTAQNPNVFLKNGYLFLTTVKALKAISISAIFYDYLEALFFPSICGECEDCECIDIMDTDFPMNGTLIRPLIQLANNELIELMGQIKQDTTNDTSDDTSISGAMIHQPQQQEQ